MNTENKIYTATDFIKYHKGTMTFAEMHALEKAALEDPFLAEALEGYAGAKSPENDIVLLKKRVTDYSNKPNKSFVSSFINARWMRIAAILVVMLGIAYFFYDKYDDKEIVIAQNKISTADTQQIVEAKTNNVEPKNDIATPIDKSIVPSKEKEGKLINKNVEKLLDNNIEEAKKSETSNAVSPVTIQQENVRADEEKRNLATTANQQNNAQNYSRYYTQQGNVTDLKGGPLQNVTVTDRYGNNRTTTDNKGQFKLKTTDSNAYVSVASIGYESKDLLLSNNTIQKITLDKKNDNLEEVVVVSGYSTKRKKAEVSAVTTSTTLNGKVPGLNVETKKPTQPLIKRKAKKSIIVKSDSVVNNTKSFDEYVKNNIIPVFDENNIPVKGKVTLSFKIDKNGTPKNITIITSTCQPCNSQAINLLKNGPLWLNKILQPQNVIIVF